MLRNRVISSLIALGALSLFSFSALAQDTAKPGDKKPADKMAAGAKKPGAQRDAKGRFIKAGGAKMASGSKMATGSKMAAGKPVWNAKINRWQGPDGKLMKEADALKAGGKK